MMEELARCGVAFDPLTHTYTAPDGTRLPGVTGILSRQLFPDKYVRVPERILAAAAEKGKTVHAECGMVDGAEDGFPVTEEAMAYLRLKKDARLEHVATEYLVSDGVSCASMIDKVYRAPGGYTLADIKTTSEPDRDYAMWQLSVYAWLFERQNPGARVRGLLMIWLRGSQGRIIPVRRVPEEEVRELLARDAAGLRYTSPYLPDGAEEMPREWALRAAEIADVWKQAAFWERRKKEIAAELLRGMAAAGAREWRSRDVSVTRKDGGTRRVFDIERFEADHPGEYERYLAERPAAGSVTLRIIKENTNDKN